MFFKNWKQLWQTPIFTQICLSSERNSDDKKCLVMKQFLSQEKLEEIQEIIEMKITHRSQYLVGSIPYMYILQSTVYYRSLNGALGTTKLK